jgi:hypothetical protein
MRERETFQGDSAPAINFQERISFRATPFPVVVREAGRRDAAMTCCRHIPAIGDCKMSVSCEQKGDKIILTIDASEAARKAAPESKSKKTRLLGSTNGFVRVGDVSISVNATLPPVTA